MNTCRKEVAQLHGETFARDLTITSLEELARFVHDCDVGRRTSAKELMNATQDLASALLARQVPDQFLKYV